MKILCFDDNEANFKVFFASVALYGMFDVICKVFNLSSFIITRPFSLRMNL